jgi:hypothetical protein
MVFFIASVLWCWRLSLYPEDNVWYRTNAKGKYYKMQFLLLQYQHQMVCNTATNTTYQFVVSSPKTTFFFRKRCRDPVAIFVRQRLLVRFNLMHLRHRIFGCYITFYNSIPLHL